MIPPAGPSIPVVAAAGGDWVRPLNADISLIEVKRIASPLSTRSVPQTFQVELVEESEAVVHVFERQIVRTDARSFIEDPAHAVGALLPLFQSGRDGHECWPGLAMV